MNNKLVFNNISDDITEVKLHIPCVDDVRYLFLHVEAKLLNCRFVLWGIELPALKSIDELDNQCIHLYGNGDGFEDGKIGTGTYYKHKTQNNWQLSLLLRHARPFQYNNTGLLSEKYKAA